VTVIVLRADARRLPLPDASVDLIITSPPYWSLRSYGGYDREIGSEPTPQEYLEILWECVAEWARVLKPEGSMFIDLGDKYAERGGPSRGAGQDGGQVVYRNERPRRRGRAETGMPEKSLLALPWRFAIGAVDRLGLILREDVIWHKTNGLPESVTDRCRRAHEYVFHLTKQPRYYSAVDEIREAHTYPGDERWKRQAGGDYAKPISGHINSPLNPFGKLPSSVWSIASEPLILPDDLPDHFAAFPSELPRRIIAGWCPREVCTACGQGRRPVMERAKVGGWERGTQATQGRAEGRTRKAGGASVGGWVHDRVEATIIGYACDCTPYTDHPERRGTDWRAGGDRGNGARPLTSERPTQPRSTEMGPVREYHCGRWQPPPATPGIILDPFGGTGTSAHVASALGRIGISVDRSADYARIAAYDWLRRARMAKVLGLDRPEKPRPDATLFDFDGAAP
jgi:DNA modification methylase